MALAATPAFPRPSAARQLAGAVEAIFPVLLLRYLSKICRHCHLLDAKEIKPLRERASVEKDSAVKDRAPGAMVQSREAAPALGVRWDGVTGL